MAGGGGMSCPRDKANMGELDLKPDLSDSRVLPLHPAFHPALAQSFLPLPFCPPVGLASPGSPQLPAPLLPPTTTSGLWLCHQLGRWNRHLVLNSGPKEERKKEINPKFRVLLPVTSLSAKSSGTEGVGTASPWFSWAF